MKLYQYGKKTDREIQEECKKLFISEYVRNNDGKDLIIKTTDGIRVVFNEKRFEHAFSREDRHTKVRSFDHSRARKVLWIKQLIKEKFDGATVLKRDATKTDKKIREYYLPQKQYLVILNWDVTSDPHRLVFNTAYAITMTWKRNQLEKNFGIKKPLKDFNGFFKQAFIL